MSEVTSPQATEEQSPVDAALEQSQANILGDISKLLGTDGGNLDLDKLLAFQKQLSDAISAEKAKERERTEAAKRAKRSDLMVGIVSRLPADLFTAEDYTSYREAGLLGITITFPTEEGGSIGFKEVSSTAPAPRASQPRTGADGTTPAKSSAGGGARPGDSATYESVTTEAERAEDTETIERRVKEAIGKGSFGGNESKARNSIGWSVRSQRIAAKQKEAAS